MQIFLTVMLIFPAIEAALRLAVFNGRSYSLVCFFVVLMFLSSFRTFEFGPDTYYYMVKYNEIIQYSWSEFISVILVDEKDPVFYGIAKLLGDIGVSDRQWLALLSLIFLGSVSIFVYLYSPYPYFSFAFLIADTYLYFSYTGLRQTMAMAFVVGALICYLRARYAASMLFVAIASVFHFSALVVSLVFIIEKLGILKYWYILVLFSLALSFVFSGYLHELISFLEFERLSSYSGDVEVLNATGLLMSLSYFLFAKIFIDKNIRLNRILLNMALLGVVFQAMSVAVAEFFRIGMYFGLSYIVLLPLAIASIRAPVLRLASAGVIYIALLSFFIISKQFNDFELLFR